MPELKSKFIKAYKFFGVVALLGLSLVGYQNCSSSSEGVGLYQSRGAGGSKNQDASCIVNTQCEQDENAITLTIGNNDPIYVTNTEFSIDVVGTCDTGNYPFSQLYYEILDAGNVVVKTETNAQVVCDDRGRYWIQVILPGAYNHAATHKLKVRLTGRTADLSQEVDNPNGLNVKVVNIQPRN